jgi:hypothetical protein
MKRTIAVVTSSRADYSHLYWPLHDLLRHPEVDLKVIVLRVSNVCLVPIPMSAWPKRWALPYSA